MPYPYEWMSTKHLERVSRPEGQTGTLYLAPYEAHVDHLVKTELARRKLARGDRFSDIAIWNHR